jgi:protein-S-isoprenylcysteine O-methyltransferase Ste14
LTMIDSGVYARVRHPMYMGTFLIYVGLALLTFSFLAFGALIGIFLVYNYLATYEEKDLVRVFGESYLDYCKRVPKWIPRLSTEKR